MRPTTADRAAGAAPAAAPARPEVPRLADGVELLGRFEDSGFVEPPYLARRGDGQVIQLTPLLHHVAEAADGRRTSAEVAEVVGAAIGRQVTADDVDFLVGEKLRPLGVMAAADGSSPPRAKADPLLALRMRREVVSEQAVWRIAGVFRGLFAAPVVVLVLLGVLAFDAYVLLEVGAGGGLRAALYEPALLLGLFAATILATAFHEVGHASACRYGGARPGGMGAAIYLVWPAFFCDVTDAYRLDRRGRLRVDLGGVYFNGVVCLLVAGLYLATRFEPLILLLVTQHLLVAQQLLPLLRFDGYYVLSDLAGVPDVLGRVKPVLRSLLPGHREEPRVTELKPWARRTVRVYVLALVPLLGGLLVVLALVAPRMVATAWDALGLQTDRVSAAAANREILAGAVAVVQSISLALPLLGIALSLGRVGRRAGAGLLGWASGSAVRGAIGLAGSLALVGGLAALWWPNGEYQPLRPGEKGTVHDAVRAARSIPTGRPSFTPERAVRYRDVPTVREREATERRTESVAPRREEDEATGEPGATTTAPEATTTSTVPAATTPAPVETVPAEPVPEEPVYTETVPTE